jgi:hypothetical protein
MGPGTLELEAEVYFPLIEKKTFCRESRGLPLSILLSQNFYCEKFAGTWPCQLLPRRKYIKL